VTRVVVSMIYIVFIEYPLKTTCMVILNVVPSRSSCRSHMNIGLAHELVDDYVSEVMNMEMLN
jgi:hypothetical protein